jgi:hypothetical protein
MVIDQIDVEHVRCDSLEELCTRILTFTKGCKPSTIRISIGVNKLLCDTLHPAAEIIERSLQASDESLRVNYAFVNAYDYDGHGNVTCMYAISVRVLSPMELLIGL